MKGLILKDLYLTKNNSKFFLLFLAVFGVLSITQGDGGMSFLPFCIILCSILVISSLSYDELAKWDRMALCMPVTRRQIVLSKYLLHLIFTGLGVGLGLLIGIGSNLIHNTADYASLLTMISFSATIALAYGAIMLPLVFRFGPEKGRIIILLLAIVPAALIGASSNLSGSGGIHLSSEQIKILGYAFPAAALALYGLSYLISARIYQKKQF